MDLPRGLLTSRLAKGEAVSWNLYPKKVNKILDEIVKDDIVDALEIDEGRRG